MNHLCNFIVSLSGYDPSWENEALPIWKIRTMPEHVIQCGNGGYGCDNVHVLNTDGCIKAWRTSDRLELMWLGFGCYEKRGTPYCCHCLKNYSVINNAQNWGQQLCCASKPCDCCYRSARENFQADTTSVVHPQTEWEVLSKLAPLALLSYAWN